jgi:hypothetical protein
MEDSYLILVKKNLLASYAIYWTSAMANACHDTCYFSNLNFTLHIPTIILYKPFYIGTQ